MSEFDACRKTNNSARIMKFLQGDFSVELLKGNSSSDLPGVDKKERFKRYRQRELEENPKNLEKVFSASKLRVAGSCGQTRNRSSKIGSGRASSNKLATKTCCRRDKPAKSNWEAGIRTPISRSRVCGPTVGRPPKENLVIVAEECEKAQGIRSVS